MWIGNEMLYFWERHGVLGKLEHHKLVRSKKGVTRIPDLPVPAFPFVLGGLLVRERDTQRERESQLGNQQLTNIDQAGIFNIGHDATKVHTRPCR